MPIENWIGIVGRIDYAFQPIVNINTGRVIAYEALLRSYEQAGFDSIQDFFNRAYRDQVLHKLDLLLREKALKKFVDAGFDEHARLFYNIDNRLLEMYDYKVGETSKILETMGLPKNIFTFEISEKHEFKSLLETQSIFNLYQQQGYQIALDDFGTGFSGLKLLYHSEPNYIKIDRFFITDIFKDSKKRLFITNIINIAHSIGAIIIAEGVETKEEYFMCKEIGCDCVQGYYIARPVVETARLKEQYENVKELAKNDKRTKDEKNTIKKYLKAIDRVSLGTTMEEIFEIFKNSNYSYLVVVDDLNRPVGLLREKTLRKYIYNPFGSSLLVNKKLEEKIEDFITRCSSVEIHTDISRIIKAFSFNNRADGVIITKNFEYYGFIDARDILDYLSNRNIMDARNQNPLSKLPGNRNVEEFILRMIENREGRALFTYFDFDNFKPFNDTYGFRNGDRAILLFSDILRKKFKKSNYFVGHIGGDDFFMGCLLDERHDFDAVAEDIDAAVRRFAKDVESFYNPDDQQNGYIESVDREGNTSRFPLLTVSAATLVVDFRTLAEAKVDEDCLSSQMAGMKKVAKKSPDSTVYASLVSHCCMA